MTVKEIIDIDEKVNELAKDVFDSVPLLITKSSFPLTGKLLIDSVRRINELKEGIFNVYYCDNYYCSRILLRVLIEHFLIGMYVIDRFNKDENDSIGKEYYTNWKREEEIQYWEANSKIAKTIKKDDIVNEIERIIYEERFPYLKEIPKKELKKLNRHFAVNEIIQYFLKDIDFSTIDPDTPIPQLGNLRYFRDFAQLSSFIHCGPIAIDIWDESIKKSKTDESILSTAKVAFEISKGFKDLVLVVLYKITKDKKYFEISEKINKIGIK